MAKIIGELKALLGLDKSKYDKGLKDAQTSSSKFGSAIKKLGGILAAAFAVAKIVQWGKEVIGLASKVEGVKIAFDRLNKPNLLANLQKATRGTVSDLSLMQKAVQAKNFKIPLDQLATYFEFATKRAIQTGESVDYLVDSIITGIGRKSVLVMDNLGISAVELQKEVAKTGDFATAAGVIIQRELKAMGDVADTTATKMASITTSITNIKTGIGLKITKTAFFTSLIEMLDKIAAKMSDITGDSSLTKEQLIIKKEELEIQKQILEARGYEKQAINDGLTGLKKFTPAARENREGIVATIKELDKVEKSIEEINILLKNASNIPPPDLATEGAIETITTLTAELEKEKKALTDINVADEIAIRNQIQKINLLERYIKQLSTERGIVPIKKEDISKAITGKKDIKGAIPIPKLGAAITVDTKTLAPALATANHEFIALLQNIAAVQDKEEMLGQVTTDVFSGFADVISQSFMATGNVLKNFGKFFIDFIKGMIVKLVAAAIAALALAVVISLIPGLNVGMGANMAKAKNFGEYFKAGLSGISGYGKGFAAGGVIPGGYSNDTFPAMLTSGERVLTPAQNMNYESGGGPLKVIVEGKLKGTDMYLQQVRTVAELNSNT